MVANTFSPCLCLLLFPLLHHHTYSSFFVNQTKPNKTPGPHYAAQADQELLCRPGCLDVTALLSSASQMPQSPAHAL